MRNQRELSISFLGPANASSTVHRCLLVAQELDRRGYECNCFSLSGPFSGKVPNLPNHVSRWRKILGKHPDFLILHRSSNLVDYEMIKRVKKSRSETKVIFDYDDAIFHTRLPGRIVAYSHLNKILSVSDGVTAGSHYLKAFADMLNENVTLLPSAVDMELFNPSVRSTKNGNTTTIGWLGSGVRWQLPYLRILKEPLNALAQKYDVKLRIVSALSKAVRKEFVKQRFEVDFGLDHWIPLEQTPELIADFDIGVMPLTDDKWSQGKCAMKLLEYMSMKLATVASAVGENRYVIDHGRNGFLAKSPQEWMDYLERLIVDRDLRKDFGENGYVKVKRAYSLPVVVDTLEHVIRQINETHQA